jgi:hypothetical protein
VMRPSQAQEGILASGELVQSRPHGMEPDA